MSRILIGSYLWPIGEQTEMLSSTFFFFVSLLYKTNKFHITMHLFRKRLQKTANCVTNIIDTHV